jgi:hypothetical protein
MLPGAMTGRLKNYYVTAKHNDTEISKGVLFQV